MRALAAYHVELRNCIAHSHETTVSFFLLSLMSFFQYLTNGKPSHTPGREVPRGSAFVSLEEDTGRVSKLE